MSSLGALDVGAAYDRWAEPYTRRFGDPASLAREDRELVLGWAHNRTGAILDAGCGPGTWAGLLTHHVGQSVVGLDVSERFLDIARVGHPGVPFVRGSLAALPLVTGALDGVLAWYSLIHVPPDRLVPVLRELRRVLRTGGSLVVGFVDGPAAEPFDHTVVLAYSWSAAALGALLEQAGFAIEEEHRRQDQGVRPHGALVATAVEVPDGVAGPSRSVTDGALGSRRPSP